MVRAISRAQSAVVQSNDPKPLYEDLLDVVLELSGSEFGFIGEKLLEADGTPYLRMLAISNIAWNAESRAFYKENAALGLEFRNLETLFGLVVKTGQFILANDAPDDPRAQGTPAGHPPIQSFLGLPFEQNGELLGIVAIANRPGGYDESFVTFAEPLLNACGFILDYHRTRQRRQDLQRELAGAHAHLAAVLDASTHVAIIATDTDGLITDFNSGAENMLGYSAEEMVGHRTPAIIHLIEEIEEHGKVLSREMGREIGGFEVFVAKALDGQHDRREWTYVRKDGSRLTVELTVTAVRDDHSEITGFLGIAVDVTRRRQAQAELLRAKEEAEAANRAKSEFLAKMSHEIRTPMNGIMGMAELLDDTPLTEEQLEYTSAISGSANVLLEIINEVLDYSKIEARGLVLEQIPFKLRQVAEETLGRLRIRAVQQNLELTWSVDDAVPDRLVGDPVRLRQVLVNLVGNAIKFTEEGGITVNVSLAEREESNARLRFDVTDTGIGIPPERQQAIFEPFSQANNATSRRYGGTGLGLAIARELVELMDGTLSLTSREGEGSTFHFSPRFVIDDSMPADETATLRPVDRAPSASLRILLAEDNEINQKFALRALAKMGHDVVLACNGIEAVEAWGRQRFDVILMDIQMPEMDGFEAMARIREAEHTSGDHVPIIAVTAHALDGYAQKCLDGGADGYLSKPLRTNELFETLERLGTTAPASESVATRQPVREHERLVDREQLFSNLDDDAEFVLQLIGVFEANVDDILAEIADAREHRDHVRLKRAVHSLKGSLSIFAAESTRDLASTFEQLPDTHADDESAALLDRIVEEVRRVREELRAIRRETQTA